MSNDLLKRIDESFFFVVDADGQQRLNRLLEDCRAEIERLSKPYVPMTAEQVGMLTVFDGLHNVETPILAEYIRNIETAVIKRAGLDIKHD